MPKLTISELVDQIALLGTQNTYEYFTKKGRVRISNIVKPEGPINFVRWKQNEVGTAGSRANISNNQLGTIASVFSAKPNYPIHLDRLFSAGNNNRSALETLLACTPHFFICYPQKINPYTGETENNLKHIMWCPEDEHELGVIKTKDYEQIISEVELGADYGNINITPAMLGTEFDSIEAKKTHTQMQVALVEIGRALNFNTWIARNDRSIPVGNKRLGELEGVIPSLKDVSILYNNQSKEAAALIDCIWFSGDGNHIPAVIEVEHSTGVTSGLTRMLKFKNTIPAIEANFTVVAPNDLRNKVVSEANNIAFRVLKARFMPYSTVRELYGLIQRYSLSRVVERTFIEPFMENIVE